MATYDHKQVLTDYANGKITPEMATGHALQHIGLLYDGQNEAKASRLAQQSQLERLDESVANLQTAVARLTNFMEKVQRAQKKRLDHNQPSSDQS